MTMIDSIQATKHKLWRRFSPLGRSQNSRTQRTEAVNLIKLHIWDRIAVKMVGMFLDVRARVHDGVDKP